MLPGLQSRLKPQDLHAEKRTSSPAAPSLSALPTEDPSVPFSSTPMPSAAPMLPLTAAGIFSSTGDVFSAYASLSNVLSPQKLQEFLVTLTKPGQGDLRSQVTTSHSQAPITPMLAETCEVYNLQSHFQHDTHSLHILLCMCCLHISCHRTCPVCGVQNISWSKIQVMPGCAAVQMEADSY